MKNNVIPKTPAYKFVDEYANPFLWVQTAEDLHDQAMEMKKKRSSKRIITGNVRTEYLIADRAACLLAGLALENAIKSFLVYENPSWVSNGKLCKHLRSHDLIKLRNSSNLIPYKTTRHGCLKYFSEGVESWSRYPCGLDWKSTKEFNTIAFATMWEWYQQLMQAYGRKIALLFVKGWKGPHGFQASWEFTSVKHSKPSGPFEYSN